MFDAAAPAFPFNAGAGRGSPRKGGQMSDLLGEARERLRQLMQEEGENPNAEAGEVIEVEEGEHFEGRWRSNDGMLHTKRGKVGVYLLWDKAGKPRFHFQQAALVEWVEELQPQVGDEVLILRGPTKTWEQDGETHKKFRYVLRCRPCSDPLPGAELKPAESTQSGPLGPDEDLPFLCLGEQDPRSVPAAAAVIR
jgi:hypothetical protein